MYWFVQWGFVLDPVRIWCAQGDIYIDLEVNGPWSNSPRYQKVGQYIHAALPSCMCSRANSYPYFITPLRTWFHNHVHVWAFLKSIHVSWNSARAVWCSDHVSTLEVSRTGPIDSVSFRDNSQNGYLVLWVRMLHFPSFCQYCVLRSIENVARTMPYSWSICLLPWSSHAASNTWR